MRTISSVDFMLFLTDNLLPFTMRHHKPLLMASGVVLLYIWSFFARSSYLYFFLGALSVLVIEAIFFWKHIERKIHRQNGQRITLELAKVEVRKIFGDDIGINYNDVENKMQKKKYYENNKSKAVFKQEATKPKVKVEIHNEPIVSSVPASASASISIKDETSTPANIDVDQSPIFSHKQINELIKMKEQVNQPKETVDLNTDTAVKKPSLEDKIEMVRISRRPYLDQLNEFMNILSTINSFTKVHGKALAKFDSKPGVFGIDESVLLKPEEKAQNICSLEELVSRDKEVLKKVFGSGFIEEKKTIDLPEWRQIKLTVNEVGDFELNCAKFVEMVSMNNVNLLSSDYEKKYEDIKKDRLKAQKDYEEAHIAYIKIKTEYDALNKTLESTLSEYQTKFKKKLEPEVVLKHEMKARLVKSQIDSLTNKLTSSTDELQEAVRVIDQENEKIANFEQRYDQKKESTCCNSLKGVMLMCQESVVKIENSLETLFKAQAALSPRSDSDKPDAKGEDGPAESEEQKQDDTTKPASPAIRRRSRKLSNSLENIQLQQKKRMSAIVSRPSAVGDDQKLYSLLEEFKIVIEEYNISYADDVFQCGEEAKKSKELSTMLKSLAEYEDENTKERAKLISLNFMNRKGGNLSSFWKMFQNNLYFINVFSTQLHSKITSLDKSYGDFMRNVEKDLKTSDTTIQNAIKRASLFVKNFEKELQKREEKKDKKDFFTKLFNLEDKAILSEESLAAERKAFTDDLERSLFQMMDILHRYNIESNKTKRGLIIAYLACYSEQKESYDSFVNETDKMLPAATPTLKEEKDRKPSNESAEETKEPTKDAQNERITISPEKPTELALPAESPFDTSKLPLSPLSSKTNQVLKESVVEEVSEWQGPENIAWINRLFKVFAMEWARSGYFKEKITKIFFKSFNKKRSKFLRRINIKDIIIEPKFPDIRNITPLPSDNFEFLYDFQLAYQGSVMMEIETRIEPQPIINFFSGDQPIPLTAKILLKSFTGKVRLCWVPSEYGRSWFSFVGQPILNLTVEPKIGTSQFDISIIPQATTLITDLIMRRLKKMTYPYRKELDLPLAFRSPKIVPPPE